MGGGGREPQTTCSSGTGTWPTSGIPTPSTLHPGLACLAAALPASAAAPGGLTQQHVCARHTPALPGPAHPQTASRQHAGLPPRLRGPRNHPLSSQLPDEALAEPHGPLTSTRGQSITDRFEQGVLCLEGNSASRALSSRILLLEMDSQLTQSSTDRQEWRQPASQRDGGMRHAKAPREAAAMCSEQTRSRTRCRLALEGHQERVGGTQPLITHLIACFLQPNKGTFPQEQTT